MMIQPVGVLQAYSVRSNTPSKGGRVEGSSRTGPDNSRVEAESDMKQGNGLSRKSDSLSISVEGVTAYANRILREKALTEINRQLSKLDENAQSVEELDPASHNPEKTADTIVSLSTGFFDTYAQGHPELQEQGLLDGFMEVISSGIKRGLQESRDLLKGLDVLNGLVEQGVDETDSLIWEKLGDYYKEKLEELSSPEEQTLDEAA